MIRSTLWLRVVLFVVIISIFNYKIFADSDNTTTEKPRYTLSGYIKDVTGEELIGATVFVKNLHTGTASNLYGFYSVSLIPGTYEIDFSFIGYETITKKINLDNNITLNVKLAEGANEIESVEVTAERKNENVARVEMSNVQLQMKEIKKIPSLLGEVDVIKSIQLLPGVTTSGEGSTGFFVRGGNVDQNLILLDGAPVYNPAHIGGFLSVFNGDAVKNVELYKGGIPAEYGGRLSSVLDVRMKEGNPTEYHGSGGIGLPISSRLTFEGPIVKGKSSFIVSGRRSYIDLFFPLSKEEAVQKSKAYFYDFNGKANYTVNEKNRIFISGYFGRDIMKFDTLMSIDFGNKTSTFRWNHLFSPKLFSNFTIIYSDFSYGLGQSVGSARFDWKANIIDYGFNNDYTFFLNPDNKIEFGFQSKLHHFVPGKSEDTGESFLSLPELDDNYAVESGIYLSNEQNITNRISIMYGLRFSHYINVGQDSIFRFDENYNLKNVEKYDKNEFYSPYTGWEPRLGIRYKINDKNSIKASYNRMYQYIQLARNSISATPLDLWFGTNPNIKPQIANQVALGYFRNFLDNKLETSIEVYYKKFTNTVDFKDHAELFLNKYIDGELRFGNGYSYGAELLIKKEYGKLSGWISYTLSKTMWNVDDINLVLEDGKYVNKPYPATYDKPHDISITMSYDLFKQVTISANWLYASAMPTTVPTSKFAYRGELAPVYAQRNGIRIPGNEYHRLDLSVNWEFKKPANSKWEHGLNFSVYNVYSRHNAYSVIFNQDPDNPGTTKATKLYLFKTIPSVTYNFKF